MRRPVLFGRVLLLPRRVIMCVCLDCLYLVYIHIFVCAYACVRACVFVDEYVSDHMIKRIYQDDDVHTNVP